MRRTSERVNIQADIAIIVRLIVIDHLDRIFIICSNVCDEGQSPVRGDLYLQRLVGIRMFSLLQNHPQPTPRAATIFRSADRALRNKRSPRHAERSACRAITRGSGGEQPTHIYSNVCDEGQSPVRGDLYLQRLVGIRMFSLLQNHPQPTPRAATIFRSADRALRNKRSPRHAERSACRAITRGSGGEQPTHIYSNVSGVVW